MFGIHFHKNSKIIHKKYTCWIHHSHKFYTLQNKLHTLKYQYFQKI